MKHVVLMVTLFVSLDVQVVVVVRICVETSVYVPVAMNCWVNPFAFDEFVGVTAIDTRVAGVTVNVVLPEIAPLVAVMVEVPTPGVDARPFEPAALLMVTVVVSLEVHVAAVVRFCVDASV